MNQPKYFKCQNFGICPLADKEELIHFDDDDKFQCASKEHTECPARRGKCREELVEVQPTKGFKLPMPVMVGVPILLVFFIIAVSIGSCGKNTPAAKEKAIAAELKKIWPWLAP